MAIDGETAARAWLIDVLGVDPAAMARLEQLVALLVEENTRQNLVSAASLDHVWQRHIVDSAQLLTVSRGTFAVPNDGAWLDLGSGAGFPGLVIAALQPQRAVTLVESRRLRTDWLVRATAAIGLDRVAVVASRIEDMPTTRFAVICARAFAPLERLLELSARFSTPQTLWLLPKGAKARHELQELAPAWFHTFHVEQSLTDSSAGILVGQVTGLPRDIAAKTGGAASPVRLDPTRSAQKGARR
ncbi:16S rRNA (guanine(527)-N(7))-methyltransferase RsmG [Novosphingobium sp.]|uniref:16S rRNA (guanine(527)-N(7))-methyltransferase RsmG n=1 Tax=Novosphingobium sp. TaxID=1874826 RepID=UPI00334240B1